MEHTIEEVIEQAMDLNPSARLLVAERLYASIEETQDHHDEWTREAQRRLDDYRNGRVESFSAEEVRKEIDQILGT
jgi:putative addiction module component (TIGR02574 family)